MLLTVAPNPTIDRILNVPHMTVGEVHRATNVTLVAAGKGLNVARAAHTLGCPVLATGPLGGRSGQIVVDLAQTENFPADWYWLSAGDTRTCLLINHADNDATVINEPGPTLSSKDWAGLTNHINHLAKTSKAVAFAGSLPPGIPPESFAALCGSLAAGGRAVYVDTSAAALASLLKNPDGVCIKVNEKELAAGFGLTEAAPPLSQTIDTGKVLLSRGAALVVVTLGRRGALAITPNGVWQATPPPMAVISTVGSGDSMLAGLAVARLEAQPLETALAFGVACGSANAMSDVPGQFERRQVEELLAQIELAQLG